MKRYLKHIALSILLSSSLIPAAAAQSGGTFSMTKSVVAGGGQGSPGTSFAVEGTVGQAVAGTTSSGSGFAVSGGFWTSVPPPVVIISVSGRVTTPGGLGLRNAIVTMIDSQGTRRMATTGSFGLYTFEGVATGTDYTLVVSSKRFRFAPRLVTVQGSLSDVNFVGLE